MSVQNSLNAFVIMTLVTTFLVSCDQKKNDAPAKKVSPTPVGAYDQFGNYQGPYGTGNNYQNQFNNQNSMACVNANCPPVSVQVRSLSAASTGLYSAMTVRVGDNHSSWQASSTDASDRQFSIYEITASPQSQNMAFSNQRSQNVSLRWQVGNNDPQQGTLTFRVRDMTRCQRVSGNMTSNCSNFSTTGSWDTTSTLQWNVQGSNGMNNLNGNGLNSGLPYLIAMLSGGKLGNIPGGMGGLGGMSGVNGMGGVGMNNNPNVFNQNNNGFITPNPNAFPF